MAYKLSINHLLLSQFFLSSCHGHHSHTGLLEIHPHGGVNFDFSIHQESLITGRYPSRINYKSDFTPPPQESLKYSKCPNLGHTP